MKLISADELAQRLGVPPVTVYSWAKRGKIPHYKLGRSVRFDQVEIEAWLLERYKPAKLAAGG